jgi:hypothetical protein
MKEVTWYGLKGQGKVKVGLYLPLTNETSNISSYVLLEQVINNKDEIIAAAMYLEICKL